MRRGAAIGTSLMFVCLAMLGLASSAIADRAFTPRFSTTPAAISQSSATRSRRAGRRSRLRERPQG